MKLDNKKFYVECLTAITLSHRRNIQIINLELVQVQQRQIVLISKPHERDCSILYHVRLLDTLEILQTNLIRI